MCKQAMFSYMFYMFQTNCNIKKQEWVTSRKITCKVFHVVMAVAYYAFLWVVVILNGLFSPQNEENVILCNIIELWKMHTRKEERSRPW